MDPNNGLDSSHTYISNSLSDSSNHPPPHGLDSTTPHPENPSGRDENDAASVLTIVTPNPTSVDDHSISRASNHHHDDPSPPYSYGEADAEAFTTALDTSRDPYNLSQHIKSEEEIVRLRRVGAGMNKFVRKIRYTLPGDGRRERQLEDYYRTQNESIRNLLKSVDEHESEATQSRDDNNLRYQIAVKGSLVANICLSGLQLFAAINSGSLALVTTMVDSVFDPLSGVMLFLSHRAVQKVDTLKYPSGRARISTAGNIVFSFVMFSVSLVLVVMSIRQLIDGSDTETNEFKLASVIAVAVAFCTKLVLFLYCWTIKDLYSQVEILWRDHRNDLFINSLGILTFSAGSKIQWWIDPMGALVLSLLIGFLWARTAYQEFQLLIGVSAEPSFLQLITYIAMTHSPSILQIDTVRAYHSGPRLVVEVDVVLPPGQRLDIAHDVAEELQIKLERLPGVERAYVHIDYETSHKPEHDLKKQLA